VFETIFLHETQGYEGVKCCSKCRFIIKMGSSLIVIARVMLIALLPLIATALAVFTPFLPLIVNAIAYSSIIAMLSSGLTLTYMTTKVPNFAQGSLATITVYLALTVTKVWNQNPYLYAAPAFGISGVAGLGLYYLVMRPLLRRAASLVTLMIATVGFDLFLFSIINIYADFVANAYRIPTTKFQLQASDFQVRVLGQNLPGIFFVGPFAVIALTILLHIALTKTRFGVAMRATVENPPLAGVVGINIDAVYAVSWFLSGGLAGLAGLFAGLLLTGNPDLGIVILPSIFAASVVGGLTNIYGALVGGFITGTAEILGTGYFALKVSTEILKYQSFVPLVFIVITLIVAPSGLTGVDWARVGRRLDSFLNSIGSLLRSLNPRSGR
jgi:branched-chain amino acid transport system permease protein